MQNGTSGEIETPHFGQYITACGECLVSFIGKVPFIALSFEKINGTFIVFRAPIAIKIIPIINTKIERRGIPILKER